MKPINEALLQNREHAGELLARKLEPYRNSNAIVAGIPNGGVCVASVIASELCLPLEVLPCRPIKHPGNAKSVIGSVCAEEVFVSQCAHTIPQDYIYHQIALLRNAIRYEAEQYYGDRSPASFSLRTVILVDDVLRSGDAIIACLQGLRRRHATKIVLAVPVITFGAARILSEFADEIVFLKRQEMIINRSSQYLEYPYVAFADVKKLLVRSMNHWKPSGSPVS